MAAVVNASAIFEWLNENEFVLVDKKTGKFELRVFKEFATAHETELRMKEQAPKGITFHVGVAREKGNWRICAYVKPSVLEA